MPMRRPSPAPVAVRRHAPLALAAALACARPAVAPPTAPATRLTYDGEATVDPAAGTLRARWRIAVDRSGPLRDSVVFLLNPTLAVSRVAGPAVAALSTDTARGLQRLTVRFAPSASPGPTTLDVAYAGTPTFGSDSINGIGPAWVELALDGFWHPVPAGFDEPLTARVRLALPAGWDAVASGRVRRDGDAHVVDGRTPLLDVPVVAAPALRRHGAGAVTVVHTGVEPARVAAVHRVASACAADLDARFGAREPLPPVTLVLAPRGGPGYARKAYIVISGAPDTTTVPLARFVCHELAHYWSSGAVPSGPENWINEGIAEFVAARAVRALHGDSAYAGIVARWRRSADGAPAVWTPTATRRPDPRAAYAKAPLLLDALEGRIGPEATERFVRRLLTERITTTPRLLDVLREVAGADAARGFADALGR